MRMSGRVCVLNVGYIYCLLCAMIRMRYVLMRMWCCCNSFSFEIHSFRWVTTTRTNVSVAPFFNAFRKKIIVRFTCTGSLTTIDGWLDSMNERWSIMKRLNRLLAVSYFDDKYFCDCVNCSANYKPVCIYYKPALWSVACEHFVCVALIVSMMINFYCMDRIENLHPTKQQRQQHPRVTLRQLQQQRRQQHCDDSNRLIDSALTLWSVLLSWWRSSDDLTTSNKRWRD